MKKSRRNCRVVEDCDDGNGDGIPLAKRFPPQPSSTVKKEPATRIPVMSDEEFEKDTEMADSIFAGDLTCQLFNAHRELKMDNPPSREKCKFPISSNNHEIGVLGMEGFAEHYHLTPSPSELQQPLFYLFQLDH